ncbi:hypothetical protein [Colwellia sp. Arc7-635]|nr:hypothetical protein [Colwellia sp. Arc7-635]
MGLFNTTSNAISNAEWLVGFFALNALLVVEIANLFGEFSST